MNDSTRTPLLYKPLQKVRFVTAASLFDGHDASINIMRRILQATGCEVIHLGHNRSVEEIVNCALQEDAHAIAVSSYQGGHVEYFRYMLDLLRERGAAPQSLRDELHTAAAKLKVPVLGVTGTGGAGKSSLTDELIRRFRLDQDDRLRIAIISIDPSRRKSGGALLGDRIRMNAIRPAGESANIYMRSMATREAATEISKALP